MAGVINGLATTFAMEDEDCEYEYKLIHVVVTLTL